MSFGWFNWLIVVAFLLLTTWFGERLKNSGKDLNNFFKGGNVLPWWAVSLSLIATKTSASTFIAVPAFIFAASGDLSYLQATIGFAAGVIVMCFVLLKEYYEANVYSPYDFIELRLGLRTGQFTRVVYTVGTVLSQGVRLLVTAVVLSVVSGLESFTCVLIITVFAVAWSYIGGISTVIWTDVIQFFVFTLGAIFSLAYAVDAVPGGIAEIFAIADQKSKLTLIDLSTDPRKLTLWAAVIGCTFFEFGSNAVDQTVTQRALCCANLKEAQKAMAFSALGIMTTWLMAGVALGLVAFYHLNPLPVEVAITLSEEPDRIFPHFVIEQLPPGVAGLIIASIFAAGISTLDSALTALAQTSVVGIGRRCLPYLRRQSEQNLVKISKYVIVVWGGFICALAMFALPLQKQGLLTLGFKATGVVYGSLIGIALLGLFRRGNFPSILIATIVASFTVVALDRHGVNFFWWYPVGTLVTILVTVLLEKFFAKESVIQFD